MGTKIDAESIAAPFRKEIRDHIEQLKAEGHRVPKLVGLLANSDPFAKKYSDWTGRSCTTDGIIYELRETSDLKLEDALQEVNADPYVDGVIVYYPVFGNRPSFFGGSMDAHLRDLVSYRKDVEGLSHFYRYALFHNIRMLKDSPFLLQAEVEEKKLLSGGVGASSGGASAGGGDLVLGENGGERGTGQHAVQQGTVSGEAEKPSILGETEEIRTEFNVKLPKDGKCILPCTPLACVKILESLGVSDTSLPPGHRLQSKTITIVNRSEVVGHPLAAMLANDGATVYSVDMDSIYVLKNGKILKPEDYLESSLASPVGAGGEKRVPKSGKFEQAEDCCEVSDIVILGVPVKDYKLDVGCINPGTTVINVASFKNVDEEELLKIEGINWVPAVGKVTVAMLERNLLRLYALQQARM